MAVTIKQQPAAYTPAFNPQIFVALSNQIAQPNFVYTVRVTDILSGETIDFPVPPDPNDYCIYNAMPFVKSFLTTHYIPKNEYGWKQSDSIRKIRVNIGETYGGVYTAGSNIDYVVWNAALDYKTFASYDINDYLYKSLTGTNLVYLTNNFIDETYPDRSNYVYVLGSEAGDSLHLNIEGYDKNNVQLFEATIDNPFEALTNYNDKYLCIDVGHKGLTQIPSGQVTMGFGSYPFMTDDVAYYYVKDRCITGGPPSSVLTDVKTIHVKCEPRYTVYTVHFLAKNGKFETIHFSKKSEVNWAASDRSTYKKIPYQFDSVAETYTYSSQTSQEIDLYASEKETLKLSTGWLNEDQANMARELLISPVRWLDLGSSVDYVPLKVVSGRIEKYDRNNKKLYQLTADFEVAYQSHAQ